MQWLREYFQMDRRQERGFMVLAILLLVSIAFNHFAPWFFSRSEESLLESHVFIKNLPTENEFQQSKEIKYTNKKIKLNIDRFFDPNKISLEDLKSMKLPAFVADNWVKYRNSGAVFYNSDDVSKIYGLEEDVFSQLEPWIKVEKKQTEERKEILIDHSKNESKEKIFTPAKAKPEVIKLGINSADSVELLEVRGIGPFYAGAIVEYRNRLGGFIDIHQLMDLYKMDSSKFAQMSQQLFLDSVEVRRISLNTASFKEILYHPYIDYETTKYIVNKRNKLGKFAALYQIKDTLALSDSLYLKLLPYIQLDD